MSRNFCINFYNRVCAETFGRLEHLSDIPKSIGISYTSLIRTIAGVSATELSVVTGGKFNTINDYASRLTASSENILIIPYDNLIKVFNPRARFSHEYDSTGVITEIGEG